MIKYLQVHSCNTHTGSRYTYLSSLQVDYLDSSRNQAVLQMIPRVDYNRKRGHLRSHDGNEVQKTRRRPPHKLFDAQAIRYVCACIYLVIYVCTVGIKKSCKGLQAICSCIPFTMACESHKPVVINQGANM